MQMFHEYLLTNQYIEENDFDELFEQCYREIPHIEAIVDKLEILSPDDFIKALKTKYSDGSSFVEACKKLGLWEKVAEAVDRTMRDNQPNLYHFMLRRKIVEVDRLVATLDDYVAACMAELVTEKTGGS